MSDFRVDKVEVPARLHLADGSIAGGILYLAPMSPGRLGAQTVEDLMEEPGRVLPFRHADGRFVLVGKASVAAVALPASLGRPPGFWSPVPVRVMLTGRHEVGGALLLEEGAGKRLSDALNAPQSWIPLENEADLIWLAKGHIVTLEAKGA